jgi:hypothetical protein
VRWRDRVDGDEKEATAKTLLEDFRKFVARERARPRGGSGDRRRNSLVNDVIMQVIAAIFGTANFDTLTFTITAA